MGRKPELKVVSPRTGIAYKAEDSGKAAQHVEAQGSGSTVNAGATQLQFAFLSGETSTLGTPATGSGAPGNRGVEGGGVSRGHSTAEAEAGRPEHERWERHHPRPPTPVKPTGGGEVLSVGDSSEPHEDLLERILSRENMLRAWKRVKANRGVGGVDGMSVSEAPEFIRQHWDEIRSAVLEGTYRPQPVRRAEIPKATGGKRPLGIPTVLDRMIQQAIAQQLTALVDPTFSAHSYGFRTGRSAHQAIRSVRESVREGWSIAVDVDLSKFLETSSYYTPDDEPESKRLGWLSTTLMRRPLRLP